MVLIMKLHALAWNYHDGHMKPELLTDSQKERAVYKLPEFLDYAGYVFYFPSVFTGPAFDVSPLNPNRRSCIGEATTSYQQALTFDSTSTTNAGLTALYTRSHPKLPRPPNHLPQRPAFQQKAARNPPYPPQPSQP
jgi:hypothetical protein